MRLIQKKLIVIGLVTLLFFVSTSVVNATVLDNVGYRLKRTGEVLLQTGGVLAGFTFGSLTGMVRGSATGVIVGTDFTSELLGNKEGSVERAVGVLTGGLASGFVGGGFGLLMGAYDGVTYGVSDPFTKENLSLTGDYFTDYKLLD
jgi:hypothetical protein